MRHRRRTPRPSPWSARRVGQPSCAFPISHAGIGVVPERRADQPDQRWRRVLGFAWAAARSAWGMRWRLPSFSRNAAAPDCCAWSRSDAAAVSTTTGSPRVCSFWRRLSPWAGSGSSTFRRATSGRWALMWASAVRGLPAVAQISRSVSVVSRSLSPRRTRRSWSMMSTRNRLAVAVARFGDPGIVTQHVTGRRHYRTSSHHGAEHPHLHPDASIYSSLEAQV